ncbi:hypothetical protein LOK49_LG05G00442 [Camellia lanceoleosa]|uniref:Uncharacterized protein n=1 Tax=Camellia lanceoleosa TaxID=1840588 RepID=A0ACC0HLB8_9ERIC|nr:hypothetical protein LOK49_LG05G00442 [Camellia lanceoleosa]
MRRSGKIEKAWRRTNSNFVNAILSEIRSIIGAMYVHIDFINSNPKADLDLKCLVLYIIVNSIISCKLMENSLEEIRNIAFSVASSYL